MPAARCSSGSLTGFFFEPSPDSGPMRCSRNASGSSTSTLATYSTNFLAKPGLRRNLSDTIAAINRSKTVRYTGVRRSTEARQSDTLAAIVFLESELSLQSSLLPLITFSARSRLTFTPCVLSSFMIAGAAAPMYRATTGLLASNACAKPADTGTMSSLATQNHLFR